MDFAGKSGYFIILLVVFTLSLHVSAEEHDEIHECTRVCRKNATPKTCVYHFKVEWYRTLSKACWDCPSNSSHCSLPHCVSADGGIRAFISINRQLPGPAIQVCEGDSVIVYVSNHLEDGGAVTIHWHGLHMRGTPFMDGAPMVTQCAVLPANTFRYEFKADPVGTHWYHAHTGLQREDGVYGPIIIRQDEDPHSALYDHDVPEHNIMVTDWYPVPAIVRYMDLMHHIFDIFLPLSGLLNGKNRHHKVNISANESYYTPTEVFHVRSGLKYRFRMISAAGMACVFRMSVDNHTMTAIAADGAPIEAIPADTVTITPGERYDFVLHAEQPVDNYWMRGEGQGDCGFHPTNLLAIVRYEGATDDLPTGPEDFKRNTGVMFNGIRKNTDVNATYIGVGDMESFHDTDYTNEIVDMHYSLKIDFNNNDNTRFNHEKYYPVEDLSAAKAHYTPVIDNITFTLPKVPLLSQWKDHQPSWFCNQSSIESRGEECFNDLCVCTHMVELPKNMIIEITMVNLGSHLSMTHPMHLHGNYFRVMGFGKVGKTTTLEEIQQMRNEGKIQLNYKNPSERDNVGVPPGGYLILRMKTDNPGIWLFHCHIESHVEQGQGMLFKVGTPQDWEEPPENFPRCGSYGTEDSPQFCRTPSCKQTTDRTTSNECVDAGDWCLRQSHSDCHHPRTRELCCYTCNIYYGHQGLSIPCRDRTSSCDYLFPGQCYSKETRSRCCRTCERMYRSQSRGCEYGDKYSWCRYNPHRNCRRYPKSCCHTCLRH